MQCCTICVIKLYIIQFSFHSQDHIIIVFPLKLSVTEEGLTAETGLTINFNYSIIGKTQFFIRSIIQDFSLIRAKYINKFYIEISENLQCTTSKYYSLRLTLHRQPRHSSLLNKIIKQHYLWCKAYSEKICIAQKNI